MLNVNYLFKTIEPLEYILLEHSFSSKIIILLKRAKVSHSSVWNLVVNFTHSSKYCTENTRIFFKYVICQM